MKKLVEGKLKAKLKGTFVVTKIKAIQAAEGN